MKESELIQMRNKVKNLEGLSERTTKSDDKHERPSHWDAGDI